MFYYGLDFHDLAPNFIVNISAFIVVSACLGYLLPEPFTYALYFVIAILFLVIYLAIT